MNESLENNVVVKPKTHKEWIEESIGKFQKLAEELRDAYPALRVELLKKFGWVEGGEEGQKKQIEKLVDDLEREVKTYMDHWTQPPLDRKEHPDQAEKFYQNQFRTDLKYEGKGEEYRDQLILVCGSVFKEEKLLGRLQEIINDIDAFEKMLKKELATT